MAKPKPNGFQWKRMPTPFHGKEYRVWGDVDGKRKQFWFDTEKEAKAVCADRNQEREAYGSRVNLDSEARLEAFRAAQLLEGSGKSILDAVRFYLDHQKRTSASWVCFDDPQEMHSSETISSNNCSVVLGRDTCCHYRI